MSSQAYRRLANNTGQPPLDSRSRSPSPIPGEIAIRVPNQTVGALIGKYGCTIKSFERAAGCKLKQRQNNVFYVYGEPLREKACIVKILMESWIKRKCEVIRLPSPRDRPTPLSRSPYRYRSCERSNSPERSRGRKRSRSRDHKRSRSGSRNRGRKRSKSRDRKRSRSRSRNRSRNRGRKRSKSRDRKRSRSRSRNHSRNRDRSRSHSRERSRERIREQSPKFIKEEKQDADSIKEEFEYPDFRWPYSTKRERI